jgi:hypothetical protein
MPHGPVFMDLDAFTSLFRRRPESRRRFGFLDPGFPPGSTVDLLLEMDPGSSWISFAPAKIQDNECILDLPPGRVLLVRGRALLARPE